jgi:hypothetical protein
MKINSQVRGLDFKGNNIEGTVVDIVRLANVAIIRINEDRTGLTEAYVEDLKEMN